MGRFLRYVAERYGLRRGTLPRAIADLIARVSPYGEGGVGMGAIVGLSFQSDYRRDGEDAIEALRKVYVPDGSPSNT